MVFRELAAFEDFRRARLDDAGFIVISDGVRSSVVHRLNGRCITADNFRSSSISEAGNSRSSRKKYYLVDSVSSGIKELGATVCRICKPLRPDSAPWKE